MKRVIEIDENHFKVLQKMSDCGLGYYNELILASTPLEEEFEEIKDKIKWESKGQSGAFIKAYKVFDIIDKHISELKGEKQEENHYKLENNITKEEAFKIIRNACDKAIEELKGENNE